MLQYLSGAYLAVADFRYISLFSPECAGVAVPPHYSLSPHLSIGVPSLGLSQNQPLTLETGASDTFRRHGAHYHRCSPPRFDAIEEGVLTVAFLLCFFFLRLAVRLL